MTPKGATNHDSYLRVRWARSAVVIFVEHFDMSVR